MNNNENECKECLEQARLLGMSAEREADLLVKLERERALADRLAGALTQVMRDEQDLTFRRGWINFGASTAAIAAWKEARSE